MITITRQDDYDALILSGLLQQVDFSVVNGVARRFYQHMGYRHMLITIGGEGLFEFINHPTLVLTRGFDGENSEGGHSGIVWSFGYSGENAPSEWRDGYVKVGLKIGRNEDDRRLAKGTLVTTLDAVWQRALGPTTILMQQMGISTMPVRNPKTAAERSNQWVQTVRNTYHR